MPSVPPCSSELCARYHAQVAAVCREMHWPPGQPVLLVQPDGSTCTCTCGAALAAHQEHEPGPESVGPCRDTACYLEPQMIELCQEYPPGQTVILNEGSGQFCYCYCWGGKLAPCTVANGEGEQVPMDAIPVGGFVMAAGLDLGWKRMLLRWASRPWQSSPQQGYEITVAGSTMLVPSSHIYLTAQAKLILARQMDLSIPLMARDGSPAPVDHIEVVSTRDSFQLLATADVDPGDDLAWHLLDTQGVVSADHAVEKAYQERRLPPRLLAFPYGS